MSSLLKGKFERATAFGFRSPEASDEPRRAARRRAADLTTTLGFGCLEARRDMSGIGLAQRPTLSREFNRSSRRPSGQEGEPMTSQGRARGRFGRAIRERNLFMAELAARELRSLALNDALDLVALIAAAQPERLERAAVRWHGRLELESQLLTLAESELALAALGALRADPSAIEILRRLLRRSRPTLGQQIS